jgi:hypothetical protein
MKGYRTPKSFPSTVTGENYRFRSQEGCSIGRTDGCAHRAAGRRLLQHLHSLYRWRQSRPCRRPRPPRRQRRRLLVSAPDLPKCSLPVRLRRRDDAPQKWLNSALRCSPGFTTGRTRAQPDFFEKESGGPRPLDINAARRKTIRLPPRQGGNRTCILHINHLRSARNLPPPARRAATSARPALYSSRSSMRPTIKATATGLISHFVDIEAAALAVNHLPVAGVRPRTKFLNG